ncbi:MAG: single-stranded DNA-binding protein [Filifactoraceae bacterium]
MNNCSFVGRLVKDPELKFAAGTGTAFIRFTIAVQRDFKNAQGQYEADFINCVAYKGRAEMIGKYFNKGSQIALTGSIRTGSYDAQDGTKRYTTELLVGGVGFCGGSGQGNSNTFGGNNNNETFGGANDDMYGATPLDDGDIPF